MQIWRPSLLLRFTQTSVDFSADSTLAADALVFDERYSVPEPATCGEAIDVPEKVVVPPPRRVESTLTPGAQISTQFPKLLNAGSLLLISIAATVITPLCVPAREGDSRHASPPLLPAATA